MSLKNEHLKSFLKNLLLMLFFSVTSYLMGLIKFSLPGLEGAISDMREIPMLLSVFHLSNPIYLIGLSFFSALSTPPDGSYLTSVTMHALSLVFMWFIYHRFITKSFKSSSIKGLYWFFSVFIYYLVFLLPLLIITNYIVGLNLDTKFTDFYICLLIAVKVELVLSAVFTALYLIQHEAREKLKIHKENLETIVNERTKELSGALTQLKITQQHLVQSEKMVSLGTLTAGVAHEINNPLNFISGGINYIKELKDEIGKTKPEELQSQLGKAISILEKGLTRVTEIVKDLMTFSHRGDALLVDFDLNQIIDRTLGFLKIDDNDIKVIKKYHLQKKVLIYPDQIHQVIIHILENSIYSLKKFSNKKKRNCYYN